MLERSFNNAVQEGRVTEAQLKDKDAELARLAEEVHKLQEQLATRASEPAEAELSNLIAAGDLTGALRLKTQQVKKRRSEAEKLPRDLSELRTIQKLQFDWPQPLGAYRGAWQLRQDPESGFRYGYGAQRQNQFAEVPAVYEVLHRTCTEPGDLPIHCSVIQTRCNASQTLLHLNSNNSNGAAGSRCFSV